MLEVLTVSKLSHARARSLLSWQQQQQCLPHTVSAAPVFAFAECLAVLSSPKPCTEKESLILMVAAGLQGQV
jgi:hypothetical protein